MRKPFTDWLEDVLNDKLEIKGNKIEESQQNLWSFTFTNDQISNISSSDISEFIKKIIQERSEQLLNLKKEGLFYLWFDEFSANLMFSFISSTNVDDLPFKCKIIPVKNISEISEQVLKALYLEGIPFEELQEVDSSELEIDNDVFEQKIFVKQIPE